MAHCANCGAPLAGGHRVCQFCGMQNDIDLHGVHEFTVVRPESERICPRCDKPLQTIDLKVEGTFLIERCKTCQGMFFDPNELEALLDKSVSNVYGVDLKLVNQLANERLHSDFPASYIKCPICRKLMNRLNYGTRSGVVVDWCRDHGVWVDSGELRRLLEWTKAGGQILDQKREERSKHDKEREARRKARERLATHTRTKWDHHEYGSGAFGMSTWSDGDVLDLLSRAVFTLFR